MNEHETGWVRPQRKRTPKELQELIDQRRVELAALEAELQEQLEHARLEALIQVRRIINAQQLSFEELGLTVKPVKRRKPTQLGLPLAQGITGAAVTGDQVEIGRVAP